MRSCRKFLSEPLAGRLATARSSSFERSGSTQPPSGLLRYFNATRVTDISGLRPASSGERDKANLKGRSGRIPFRMVTVIKTGVLGPGGVRVGEEYRLSFGRMVGRGSE